MEKTLNIQLLLLQEPLLLIAGIIVIVLVITLIVLMYNKSVVAKFNQANADIIQTKTFDELLKVITSHEVLSQSNKLSDIIFRHFERVTRKEFEEYKSQEDYVSIVKLFYNITTSYNWGNNFDTALYCEFCSFLEIYTEKLLNEDQDEEQLLRNIIELNKISLELECFFEAKKNKSQTGVATKELKNKFSYLKSKMLTHVTA